MIATTTRTAVLSPCSPAKKLRTSITIERSPERFQQLHFLQFAVAKMEEKQQREEAEKEEEEEEESEEEDAVVGEPEDDQNENVTENVLADKTNTLNCDQSRRRQETKSVVARLRAAMTENGEFELDGNECQDLSEIMELFVSTGAFEKIGAKYSAKKRSTPSALPSFTPVPLSGHKAYYNHPHGSATECCDNATAIAMGLATRAATGTLGSTVHQQFLPPHPEDMHYYQTKCLESFMKRYNDFYRVVSQHANKLN